MSKAVLLSVQPKWCEKMCNKIGENKDGSPIYEKRVEVRKTIPKLETPFKVYIYCTKNKRQWLRKVGTSVREVFITEPIDVLGRTDNVKAVIGNEGTFWERGGYNGKVIGEFVCDRIFVADCDSVAPFDKHTKKYIDKESCLSKEEFVKYTRMCLAYGWHISNLVIYDKPKELSEFKKIDKPCWYGEIGIAKRDCPECQNKECFIQKPPQSWCYVEELSE